MSAAWLNVVGIGDGGLDSLPADARSVVEAAEVLVGGTRHLAMLAPDDRLRLEWPRPWHAMTDTLRQHEGRPVCVLATGDPSCHGVGNTLVRELGLAAVRIWPAPSAFSLACARLGWALQDTDTVSLHGQPVERIVPFVQPGARVVALSSDRNTPHALASLLCSRGFGPSQMTVLSHLGGSKESRLEHTAANWDRQTQVPDLNTVGIYCTPEPSARLLPRVPGIPDDAFEHDGQITKHEIRAVTLSALAPIAGQYLWDVGAGSGSVAIEWLRHDPRCRAVAIEREPVRAAAISRNARTLGVPQLQVVEGPAPAALASLPAPDAIFIGGGLGETGLADSCWSALVPGGRLVANAVSVEGEQAVSDWQRRWGGQLVRLSVSRCEDLGRFRGWRPLAPITQFVTIKARRERS